MPEDSEGSRPESPLDRPDLTPRDSAGGGEKRIGLSDRTLSIAVTGAVFAAVLIGAPLLQAINRGLGLWLSEIFLLFGVSWMIVRATGRNPPHFAGLARPPPKWIAFGAGLGATNYFALVLPIQAMSGSFFSRSTREFYDVSRMLREQSPGQLALILSGACLAAPFCEEFVFRGAIQRGLMPPAMRASQAILVTALIFSLFHLDPVGLLARVELGALFGLLFYRAGSLWPAIAAHAANNAVSTVLYFVGEIYAPAGEQEPEAAAIGLTAAVGWLFLGLVLSLGRSARMNLFAQRAQ